MRPERSTRSRKTSFPMSRRAMHPTGEATCLLELAAGLELVGRARTMAIASRSGKRFADIERRP